MTLTTHAIIGAAAAALAPQYPALGFALAFASHLAIDALPHYDYELLSPTADPRERTLRFDRRFALDLGRTGFDASLGCVLAWLLFYSSAHPYLPIIGAIGGILPDALQFAYKFFPGMLAPLQRFHERIQEGKTCFRYHPVPGLALQAATLSVLLILYVLIANTL